MKQLLIDIFELVKTVVIVLVVAFSIRNFLIQPFVVDGHSMDPNFSNQEYLIVNKLSYNLNEPKRGDVIVFRAPNNPQYDYIKRIIGLPGETVKIVNNSIFINGNKIEEKYIPENNNTLIKNDQNITMEVKLKDGQYFVLGDNREHSSDSRDWGILPKENIIGKAWFSVYPFNTFGLIDKPQYSF